MHSKKRLQRHSGRSWDQVCQAASSRAQTHQELFTLERMLHTDGHLTKEARETLLECLRETYRAGFPVLLEDAACRDDPERQAKAMARIRELNKLAGFPMKVRLSPLDASRLPAELPDIVASLSSEDAETRLSGVRLLRRFLCVGLCTQKRAFCFIMCFSL